MTKKFGNYTIHETVYDNGDTIIYKVQNEDRDDFIFKVLNTDNPTQENIVNFKREYESCRICDIYSTNIDFLNLNGSMVISFKRSLDKMSLDQLMKRAPLTDELFYKCAVAIIEELKNLHSKNYIHRDIKPANILCDENYENFEIIDFGLASKVEKTTMMIQSDQNLQGTVDYISPEQTGRVNRYIDYRTDYYSLGVTLFELFTGTLPFKSEDEMEMMHAHLSKTPPEVTDIRKSANPILSKIIQTLMAKESDDRYQSTEGILYDIKIAEQGIENVPSDFNIKSKDVSYVLTRPHKLYGRDNEIDQLDQILNHTLAGEPRIVSIAAESGMGKTSLVKEFLGKISLSHGSMINAKCESLKKGIPLSSLITAFEKFLQSFDKQDLHSWPFSEIKQSEQVLSPIKNLFSILDFITYEDPYFNDLEAHDKRSRLIRAFYELIIILTKKGNPLILFIDDIQNADMTTLLLLKDVVENNKIPYFMLIMSWRSNEIDESSVPGKIITDMKERSYVESIEMSSLETSSLSEMLVDLLGKAPDISDLANILISKTKGNPFYIYEILKNLHFSEILQFSSKDGHWIWNRKEVIETHSSIDMTTLLDVNIKHLSSEVNTFLEISSTLGTIFSLDEVYEVMHSLKINTEDFTYIVREALGTGTIYITHGDERGLDYNFRNTNISFQHDRICQGFYNRCPKGLKTRYHLTYGQNTINKELQFMSNRMDTIIATDGRKLNILAQGIDHYNRGIELVTTDQEVKNLIDLNIALANIFLNEGAIDSGHHFISIVMEKLKKHPKLDRFIPTPLFYSVYVVTSYLNGRFDEAESIFQAAVASQESDIAKAKLYKYQTLARTRMSQHVLAIDSGIEGLRILGEKISRHSGPFRLLKEAIKVEWYLRTKIHNIEDAD
ncbi:AAA family ATPase, partial [Bacteriovoracaceae bacterium]|nr:AAA family ATPase [Bacteriovoracaceae bacterium]